MSTDRRLSEWLALALAEAKEVQEALRAGYIREPTKARWLLDSLDAIVEYVDASKRVADGRR